MAYDRGDAENARLLARAPERTAYLLDEDSFSLSPYRALTRP
jgi:hypothetical protein